MGTEQNDASVVCKIPRAKVDSVDETKNEKQINMGEYRIPNN